MVKLESSFSAEAIKAGIEQHKRAAKILEDYYAEMYGDPKGKPKKLIQHIEDYLKEHGPTERETIVTAMIEAGNVRANREPPKQVRESIRRSVLSGRLIEKEGKVGLP